MPYGIVGLIGGVTVLAKVGGAVFGSVGLVVLYCVAVVADVLVATSIAINGDKRRLDPM